MNRLGGVTIHPSGSALLTDHYELTMISASLRDGTAARSCVFEVFGRRLPTGRRYGVVAGTGRLLDHLADFRFGSEDVEFLLERGIVSAETAEWLAAYQFSGDIDGYAEGELFFPGSPILTVSGTFAECVVLETLILSILNHDSAIAAGAARMVTAARGRSVIEMGSRRTHEEAAVAAARAAYLAGFAYTSNLEAGRRYAIPTTGTAAHAFTLLHDTEQAAFASQVATLGKQTTLLVDTYDIAQGIRNAIAYSSRSPETMILVSVAPRESSRARECAARTDRSPESMRTARRSGPATAIALRMPWAMSYVSTSSVVCLPSVATCEAKAAVSESCSRVKACAAVPVVGMP